MNPDGAVALLYVFFFFLIIRSNYREDGTTPFLTFFKDGLKEVKL